MPRGNPKTIKNFRLTDEAIELLEKLSGERGISQAAVIEQAVREFARSGSRQREADEAPENNSRKSA